MFNYLQFMNISEHNYTVITMATTVLNIIMLPLTMQHFFFYSHMNLQKAVKKKIHFYCKQNCSRNIFLIQLHYVLCSPLKMVTNFWV